MPIAISVDLSLLVWSVVLCVAQMLISVITAHGQVGLAALVGDRENMPVLTGIAGRAYRAHRNMLENLILFATLILIAHLSQRVSPMVLIGAHLFFWARVAYSVVYLIGVPWLRTSIWGISMLGLILIFSQVV
jgi:uncharacterized MAPEG superfamily protein